MYHTHSFPDSSYTSRCARIVHMWHYQFLEECTSCYNIVGMNYNWQQLISSRIALYCSTKLYLLLYMPMVVLNTKHMCDLLLIFISTCFLDVLTFQCMRCLSAKVWCVILDQCFTYVYMYSDMFPCDLSFLVVLTSTTFGDYAYLVYGTHTLWQASLWHPHGLIYTTFWSAVEQDCSCITCMHNVSIVLANDRPHFDATCWSAVMRWRWGRTAAQGKTSLSYAESLRFGPFRNGR